MAPSVQHSATRHLMRGDKSNRPRLLYRPVCLLAEAFDVANPPRKFVPVWRRSRQGLQPTRDRTVSGRSVIILLGRRTVSNASGVGRLFGWSAYQRAAAGPISGWTA